MSDFYQKDLECASELVNVNRLAGKRILITGATGMLCSCVAELLMVVNRYAPLHVTVAGRDMKKLKKRFQHLTGSSLGLMELDVVRSPSELPFEFIIHGASPADPRSYAKYPVETMRSNFEGTRSLLDSSKQNRMERFLYVSSGEFYGQPDPELHDFTEDYCGPVDYTSPRACYPSGKRASEALCQSYISEYGLDCVIVRPCHLFGPTILPSDSRATSEFLRAAAEGKDIVMKSAGLVERSHCYVVDAATAILKVLTDGVCGQAYNIADRHYQMTIRDFASHVAMAGGGAVVYQDPSDAEKKGYSKVARAVLDSTKLESLGWKPIKTSGSAIERTIIGLKENPPIW